MKYFVVSIVGNEWYTQRWFASEKTKPEFITVVNQSVDSVIPEIIKKQEEEMDYVEGRLILDAITPLMEKAGFVHIEAEAEADIGGDLSYGFCKSDAERKPSYFSDHAWKLILEHNEKMRQMWNERCKQENEKRRKEEAANAKGDRI